MDTISSAQFRKSYAKLVSETLVTVNGHRIGVWIPSTTTEDFTRYIERGVAVPMDVDPTLDRSFSSRPFTPAPKPARR